jgi:hypothetical protein
VDTSNLQYLPDSHSDVFKWAFGTLIFHGAAAIAAIKLRARFIQNNMWASEWQSASQRFRPIDRYVEVALVAAFSGFIALIIYQAVLYSPSGGIVISSLSWSPLA